jgi:hypothetical protein
MKLGRLATVLAVAPLAACSTVRPVTSPAQFITEKSPKVVYVVNHNGSVMEVSDPSVRGDTVLGTTYRDSRTRPVAVPLTDVHLVASAQVSKAKTALFVAGVTGSAGLVIYALFNKASGHNNWSCDYNTPSLGGAGAPTCGPTNP